MGPAILNPSVGLGLFSFTVRKVRHGANPHCSPLCRAAVSQTDAGLTHFSHALQLDAATLQGGQQTPVPRSVSALQANTLIYSNDSPAAKAGASTTITVLVNNTDAPPSDLPLEGAHLHLLMMVHTKPGCGSGLQDRLRSAAVAEPLSHRGRQACMESTLVATSRCHGRLRVRLFALICNQDTASVGPEERVQ